MGKEFTGYQSAAASGGGRGCAGDGKWHRAWQREWNMMKAHPEDFRVKVDSPRHQPPPQREPARLKGKEFAAAPIEEEDLMGRQYLAACRVLKKTSDDAYVRLGAHPIQPSYFAPYSCFLASVLGGHIEHSLNDAWAFIAPMMSPDPQVLVASLLTLDLASVGVDANQVSGLLPRKMDREALKVSPAALSVATWCHDTAAYLQFLQREGGCPVLPGVGRTLQSYSTPAAATPQGKPAFVYAASPGGMTSHRSSSPLRGLPSASTHPASARRSRSRSRSRSRTQLPARKVGGGAAQPQQTHKDAPAAGKMTVEEWLRGLGLLPYLSIFEANEVDMQVIPLLTEKDLTEMGVAIGPKRRMLASITHDLRDDHNRRV